MSYTEIYKFNKEGDAIFYDEVKNSHRGAMAVWCHLEKKYLPSLSKPENYWWSAKENEYNSRTIVYSSGDNNPMNEIWSLDKSDKLTIHEKISLSTTFDNVVVKKENIPIIIEAFNNFGFETSLPEQAKILEKLLDDDDCIAVAWNQTSINGDAWERQDIDDETDEIIPYNLNYCDKHWFLFK